MVNLYKASLCCDCYYRSFLQKRSTVEIPGKKHCNRGFRGKYRKKVFSGVEKNLPRQINILKGLLQELTLKGGLCLCREEE